MLLSFLNKKNPYFGTKTFTYYLPSPPFRKNGYQEKEFDNIIATLISSGFELIDFKLASHASEDKSGVWIVCHIGAKTKEIYEQRFDFAGAVESTITRSEIELDPNIIHD